MRHQEKGKINIILHDESKLSHTNIQPNPFKQHQELKIIDQAFSSFIGLKDFKEQIKEMYAIKLIQSRREKMGLTIPKQVLHMIFKGNPGTGKTTIARQLAKVLSELNILTRGQFIEAERADLVGEYIGQTAQKTRGLVQKALGGVLFIDEAYSLARGGDKDFGREAIDTLVKQMEDHHRDFILILAGYPKEMDHFLRLNPGLKSRFPFHVPFQDYSPNELMQIAGQILKEKEYELTDEAKRKLRIHLQKICYERPYHFSNGRYVRNVMEESIRRQSVRLLPKSDCTIDDLLQITGEDLKMKT
jgi:stage V sporulation protein K